MTAIGEFVHGITAIAWRYGIVAGFAVRYLDLFSAPGPRRLITGVACRGRYGWPLL
jgi:hypothetical protein